MSAGRGATLGYGKFILLCTELNVLLKVKVAVVGKM